MGMEVKMDRKRVLPERRYHKEQTCIYGPVLCQEEYCTQCEIYLLSTGDIEFIKSKRNQM